MINKELIKEIPINIWDDFVDDNILADSETFIIVEDSDISNEDQKICLEILMKFLEERINLPGVKLQLVFLKMWKIFVINLTHDRLDLLIDELSGSNLSFNGIPFRIYSES